MGKRPKFEGISEEVQRILDANMDLAPARRRAREAFKEVQLSIDHYLFKLPYDGVKTQESFEVNSKGVEIFSKSWLPDAHSPKAVVCFCHGYGDTCTFFFEGIARKLASCGYGVFAMDYPGFGLSEGLHGYIPSFDLLVDDVIEHYSKIRGRPEICSLPKFLFGQSLGGAVALKIHLKQPDAWNGGILVAPMCKIADDIVPPWLVTQILIGLAIILPKLKLVPQQDLAELAFRDTSKREMAAYNVIAYKHKPRLRTAVEMLKTTQEIERRLEQVSFPLLILHGEADAVTDPSVSKALYEKARSSDKTLNLYKDAYHSLLEGEPDEMIERVLGDIISWLDKHCTRNTGNTTIPSAVLDREYKMRVPYELKQGQSRLFHKLPSGLSMEVIFQKGVSHAHGIQEEKGKGFESPPLVFLHGSYHAAWCWAEHWMPFFSHNGYDCYALSLLGQGESDTPAGPVAGSLQTHAADVADFIRQELRLPPILFGHSLGALIVQYYIASTRSGGLGMESMHPDLAGAVLMCSVPLSGISGLVWRYIFSKPVAAFKVTRSLAAKAFQTSLPLCKETFFSAEMDNNLVLRYQKLMTASSRLPLLDLRKLNSSLPVPSAPTSSIDILVLGAKDDFTVDAKGLNETGRFYGVLPICVGGVAHDMMLDCSWEKGAEVVLSWLKSLNRQKK